MAKRQKRKSFRSRNILSLYESKQGKRSPLDVEGVQYIDYKDVELLKRFTSRYAKIESRNRTSLSARQQRDVTKAVKRARHMALLPFVNR